VWALLQKRCGDKPLALDSNLAFDLSIDSFDWMEIALELDHSLGLPLTSDMIAGLRTVREFIIAVTGLAERGGTDGKTTKRWALSEEEVAWLRPTGLIANIVAVTGQAID